jgi:hypothetical protein
MYDLKDFLSPIDIHSLNEDDGLQRRAICQHITIYDSDLP